MVRATPMQTYQLVQVRRHVYELRDDAGTIADIALHRFEPAHVRTFDTSYDLHAIDGNRKRVVQYGERVRTAARASSLDRYAVDLENVTLYWHALPGPRGTYCWMTGAGRIAARYSPGPESSFIVEVDDGVAADVDVLILGSYLILHTTIEADAYYGRASHDLRSPGPRDSV